MVKNLMVICEKNEDRIPDGAYNHSGACKNMLSDSKKFPAPHKSAHIVAVVTAEVTVEFESCH